MITMVTSNENVLIKLKPGCDVGIDTICRDIEISFNPVVRAVGGLFPRVFAELAEVVPSFVPPPTVEFDRLAVIIPVRDQVRAVFGCDHYHPIRDSEDEYHLSDALDDHADAFEQEPARAQGVRLLGTYVLRLLHEQIHAYDALLGVPLVAGDNVLYHPQFSTFFRYWQNAILSRHDVVGGTMAILIWNKYMRQVLPKKWRACHRKVVERGSTSLSEKERAKLDTLLVQDNWQRLEEAVLALGRFCYQSHMTEVRAQKLMEPYLADTLGPHLWGTLAYFAPAAIANKVKSSDVEVSAQEDIDATILMVLALYFNHLPWEEVRKVLNGGGEVRTQVAQVLGSIPALREVAHIPHKFGAAMEESLMDGLLPSDATLILGNSQSQVRTLPPSRLIAQLQKRYEHYSSGGDWRMGA